MDTDINDCMHEVDKIICETWGYKWKFKNPDKKFVVICNLLEKGVKHSTGVNYHIGLHALPVVLWK